MKKILRLLLVGSFCAASNFPASAQGAVPAQSQSPATAPGPSQRRVQQAPPSTVTVDGSEAMFTTMCALLAAGFESNVSAANWSPMRAQLRDRLQHQQGPAV